ncbi:hypothetical protein ACFPM0_03780 [Pseudonocardia sulfidoxydans]|uniref:hypothetical protein n=1 Tax=Pseudonocardia sulfidoxydans TaxID=54011 RepID=UPI0036237312
MAGLLAEAGRNLTVVVARRDSGGVARRLVVRARPHREPEPGAPQAGAPHARERALGPPRLARCR